MGMYGYAPNRPQTERTLEGIHLCSSLYVAFLFVICTALLLAYKINRRMTHEIADELALRRARFAAA